MGGSEICEPGQDGLHVRVCGNLSLYVPFAVSSRRTVEFLRNQVSIGATSAMGKALEVREDMVAVINIPWHCQHFHPVCQNTMLAKRTITSGHCRT